jgi:effector-binding domain-containing protein
VVVIALLVVVAYLLPGSFKVERSILIKADRATIYSMACDFNNWELWSPWSSAMDSTVVFENIGGCEVGAVHKWNGEEMGVGQMAIIEIVEGEMIKWELGFEGHSQKMIIGMTFEPEGDEWLVNWTAEGDLGYNPLFRYYGLMIDADLGEDYENGLQNLKTLCESLPDYPGIEITTVQSMPGISVKDSVLVSDLGTFMGTYMPMLYMYALRNGVDPIGHPYSIYYNWDTEGKILLEVGLPLSAEIPGESPMMAVNTPSGKVVKASLFGPYEELYTVHEALNKYIAVMELEYAGSPWEVYITDPMSEADSTKWETQVFYPIK